MLIGFGWASINVNSYPMVVEMSRGGSDVGRFTGYYYTASMSAQILTPILSGFFPGTCELPHPISLCGSVYDYCLNYHEPSQAR